MLNTINIQINPRIQSQFFFRIILNIVIITWTINTHTEINNQTG